MAKETHVVPDPAGGWNVVVPGTRKVKSHHATQRAAERQAKELLRQSGGGEAVIHGQDGRIRDAETVAPAKRTA